MEHDFGLYIINSDGTDMQQFTEEELIQRGLPVNEALQWLPDGSAWIESGEDGLYIIRADGTSSTRLVETPPFPSFDRSPDGKFVAYTEEVLVNGSGVHNITVYRIGIDGSGRRELARFQTFKGADLRWSPAGDYILIAVPRSGLSRPADLYLVIPESDGEQLAQHIFHTDEWLNDPHWSPDGQRIEFSLCDWETNTLLSISREGRNEQLIAQITDLSGCIRWLAWSPDRTQLVFVPFLREGVYVLDVSSGYYWPILSGYVAVGPLLWLPEPKP